MNFTFTPLAAARLFNTVAACLLMISIVPLAALSWLRRASSTMTAGRHWAGNPLTATLADYAMPIAAELPSFRTANTETPTPLNPLGAKGIGESGTIGSMPAVNNAVVDAVSHLGVRHIDMPTTPERVWQAIRAARAGQSPSPWREPPAAFANLPVRGGGEAPVPEVDI